MRAILKNFTIVIVTFVFTVYCEVDLTYDDKIAYTEDGRECINNCVNSTCVIDNTQQLYNCNNTDIEAPVHRTIYDKICLSRCFKVPNYTGKCYTNQKGELDYCDSSRVIEWIRDRPFTDSKGPCKNICRSRCKSCRPECQHYWRGSDYCDLGSVYNYIQSRTISGEYCRGICKAHEGRDHTWCYYDYSGSGKPEACALPGIPRQHDWSKEIKELTDIKKSICIRIQDRNASNPNSGADKRAGNDILLNILARDLETNIKHDTVHLRYSSNPINSYTIRAEDPLIPLVVRAVIRPRHIFYKDDVGAKAIQLPKNLKENLRKTNKRYNDEEGYLVSFFMSGPQEKYNVYYRKPSQYDENKKIFEFLEGNKNVFDIKVDLLVVVLYREGETRPSGIARRLNFYHSDSLVDEYYEYLPNESGDDTEMPTSFGVKSLMPTVNFTEGIKDGDCYVFSFVDNKDEEQYDIDIRARF